MSQKKILIVDDEEDMCWALEKAMQKEGLLTVITESGIKGVELFLKEKPSAVLVDYKMPDLDGLEVIKRIRQFNTSIPVILITGHGNIDIAYEALSSEATGYIIKPFSMVSLREKIRNMLDLD